MLSFSFFKKDKKTSIKKQKKTTSVLDKENGSGVEKYLQSKTATSQSTRVSKYIQEKNDLNIENEKNIALSGVAKYLETKADMFPVSSVSKYVAKKTIYEKQIAKENVSGVEKYLKTRN